MKAKCNTFSMLFAALVIWSSTAVAQGNTQPKPIPPTRQEMLKALGALKHRQPRLPLPPGEPDSATNRSADAPSGGRSVVNNGRMRALYLPEELHYRRAANADSTSRSQIPYEFATELFWIVSRVNNCHYCLGHQEDKLSNVGVSEASLLALDTDWSLFPPQQRAAFAFARQLTHAPHTIGDREIASLRTHYSDDEILEITFLVGRYNSTNRWTDSLGIPQEEHREFVSSLALPELTKSSQVAVDVFAKRPAFADLAAWESELESQSQRAARLVPSGNISNAALEPHERLLIEIPAAGELWVEQLREARTIGELPVALKDKIAFVAAREDQAWYMQHLSRKRLLDAGMTTQAIFTLAAPGADPDPAAAEPGEALALAFASKLTSNPQTMTDDDIGRLSKYFSSQQIAEIVYHVGLAALLNRLTETAGLTFGPATPALTNQ